MVKLEQGKVYALDVKKEFIVIDSKCYRFEITGNLGIDIDGDTIVAIDNNNGITRYPTYLANGRASIKILEERNDII